MKTRNDLKEELSAFSKEELINIIMQSPAVFGFVLTKGKTLKKDKNKKSKAELKELKEEK